MLREQLSRPAKSRGMKLHVLHMVLRGRVFDGKFEARGKTYSALFIPSEANIVDHKLVLTGRMGFTAPQQPTQFVNVVSASLMATQGGIGVSPVRRQLLSGSSQTLTSDLKLEPQKGPETDLQPGLHSFEPPKYDDQGRPQVEATGPLAFVGVIYFKLSPLDSKLLGIPLDMSDVQLGARFATADELARQLQLLFSDVVAALDNKLDQDKAVAALNTALKA